MTDSVIYARDQYNNTFVPLKTFDNGDSTYSLTRSWTESSASGSTTAAYVSALALDNRGVNSCKIVVKNTDSTNSLYYKVIVKHASYASGTDDELVAETSLALGAEVNISIVQAYSKVTVQVKNNSGVANYTIYYLQNA